MAWDGVVGSDFDESSNSLPTTHNRIERTITIQQLRITMHFAGKDNTENYVKTAIARPLALIRTTPRSNQPVVATQIDGGRISQTMARVALLKAIPPPDPRREM